MWLGVCGIDTAPTGFDSPSYYCILAESTIHQASFNRREVPAAAMRQDMCLHVEQ